jgi:hypothetical protein
MINTSKEYKQLLIASANAQAHRTGHSPNWANSGLVRKLSASPAQNRTVRFADERPKPPHHRRRSSDPNLSSFASQHSAEVKDKPQYSASVGNSVNEDDDNDLLIDEERLHQKQHHDLDDEDNFSTISSQFVKFGRALTCGLNKYLPPLCKAEEWETIQINARAAIAMHSSIIFWVGAWNILSEPMWKARGGSDLDTNEEVYVMLNPSLQREILYLILGIFMMMITDTLYGNAGMPGTYFPETCHWDQHVVIFRVMFGLVGSVLTWTGLYNILDGYTVEETLWRDLAAAAIGFSGLAITDTFYDMAFVYPPGTNSDDIITSRSKIVAHIKATFRALCSIVFQNFVWLGSFNCLEYYLEGSVWREMTYAVTGIFLFWSTNSFVPNSWIIVSKNGEMTQLSNINLLDIDVEASEKFTLEEYVVPHTPTFAFYARAWLALAAQVMHNTGVWMIFDVYFGESTVFKNIILMCVGLFMLWSTGVLLANASITPLITPIWQPPSVPSAGELALVASAAEEEEYDLIDATVLHSAASIMPAARGRLRRRQVETDLIEETPEDRNLASVDE